MYVLSPHLTYFNEFVRSVQCLGCGVFPTVYCGGSRLGGIVDWF